MTGSQRERERKKERSIFEVLFESSDVHNSQVWFRPQPGASSPAWSPAWVAGVQRLVCLLRSIGRKPDQKLSSRGLNLHSDMGRQHQKCGLTYCITTLDLFSLLILLCLWSGGVILNYTNEVGFLFLVFLLLFLPFTLSLKILF